MLKRLLIIVLGLYALTSCMENHPESEGPQQMVFSAVASHSTKDIITTTTYPTDVPFVVESVYYNDSKKGTEGSSFMTRQRISFDQSSGVWKPQTEHYWPEGGYIHFYAASPDLPQVTIDPEHGVEADWEIANEEDAKVDLCFAETTEKCALHPVAVPVVFYHALSQVCIKARTLKDYSFSQKENGVVQANAITVVLDSVRLNGVISAGHFNQELRSWTYGDPIKKADYKVFDSEEGLALKTDRYENPIFSVIGTILIVPQRIPEDATIDEWHHIQIRTSTTDTTTGKVLSDITYSIPKFSSIPLAVYCNRLVLDYKYTIRLALGMEDSELSATVTDWTETREIILGDE